MPASKRRKARFTRGAKPSSPAAPSARRAAAPLRHRAERGTCAARHRIAPRAAGRGRNCRTPGLRDRLPVAGSGAAGLTPRGLMNLVAGVGPTAASKGILSSNIAEAGGFLKSDAALERPDLQCIAIGLVADHGRDRTRATASAATPACCGRKAAAASASRRQLARAAAHRSGVPARRWTTRGCLLRGVNPTMEILGRPALAPFRGANVFGEEGASGRRAHGSHPPARRHGLPPRRAPAAWARTTLAVVDPAASRARHSSAKLRVADASIMPTLDRRQSPMRLSIQ